MDVLPIVTALAGALVGGLASELHSVVQGLREKRRALRLLLFNLLELRLAARHQDPRQLGVALRDYVRRRFGTEAEAAVGSLEGKQFLAQLARSLLNELRTPGIPERYRQAVEALAPHAPLLAYRLAGRDRVLDLDRALQAGIAEVIRLAGPAPSPSDAVLLSTMRDKTLEKIFDGALEDLEHSIRDVAGALWTLTRWQAMRSVRRQDEPIDQKELFEFLDRALPTPAPPDDTGRGTA